MATQTQRQISVLGMSAPALAVRVATWATLFLVGINETRFGPFAATCP